MNPRRSARRPEPGFLALAGLLFLSACVPWLRVNVERAEPPVFAVHGTVTSFFQRNVAHLSVYGAPIGEPAASRLLWQVRARGEPRRPGKVRYGEVPEGFVQTVPATGDVPALRDDWTYTVTVGGGSGSGHERFDRGGAPVTAESPRAAGQ